MALPRKNNDFLPVFRFGDIRLGNPSWHRVLVLSTMFAICKFKELDPPREKRSR